MLHMLDAIRNAGSCLLTFALLKCSTSTLYHLNRLMVDMILTKKTRRIYLVKDE